MQSSARADQVSQNIYLYKLKIQKYEADRTDRVCSYPAKMCSQLYLETSALFKKLCIAFISWQIFRAKGCFDVHSLQLLQNISTLSV
jgi:hypothetical protein